jgi:predicted transcriptional regulator
LKAIKVKDVMVPLEEYPTISHQASLYDAILELDAARRAPNHGKSEHRSLVVVDESGKVLGKLTYVDILRGLEPKYGEIGDVKGMHRFGLSGEFVTFMRRHFGLWEGSFRDLCEKASRTKIKDVAEGVSPELLVDETGSIADAVHQLIVVGDVSLFVTGEGKVTGLIRLIDAFEVMAEEIMACKL